MQQFLLYIDPGSGSYLVQMIVAAILGAAFWIKMSWRRIISFFTGRKNKQEGNPPGGQAGKTSDKAL